MTPKFLDLSDVIEIHESRITLYGGSNGIRDLGLLESALAQPKAGFAGEYLHPDVYSMAAAYLFHIARNHAFVDGNKRTALAVALVFLDINGIEIIADPKSVEKIVLETAQGNIENKHIAQFFKNNSKGVDT